MNLKRFLYGILFSLLLFGPLFGNAFCSTKRLYALADSLQIDVLHYDVNLFYDFDKRRLNGIVEIEAVRRSDQNLLFLDLIGLTIDSTLVNGEHVSINRFDQDFSIGLSPASLKNDTLIIRITYHGRPANSGTGGAFTSASRLYTVGQAVNRRDPSALRYWVPCKDKPDDKATLSMRIESSNENYVAISNGILIKEEKTESGRAFYYEHDYPIATYLIAISIGAYESFSETYISTSGDTLPLVFWVLPEDLEKAEQDWNNVSEMLFFYETVFGDFPFESYGMTEIPGRGLAMEHQTMTFMGSFLVTGDKRFEYIVAHELAHQWWGNWVTIADWRDLWLNEGFATYSEALYYEYRDGENSLRNYMRKLATHYFNEANSYGHFPLYDPEIAWGSTTYDKGAWVLHMLRHNLGDDLFFKCLQRYGKENAYGNAVSRDFIRVCETLAGRDLSEFFAQWVFRSGYPDLKISWDYALWENSTFLLVLEIVQQQGEKNLFKMPLEISIVTRKETLHRTLYLQEEKSVFELPLEVEPLDIVIDPNVRLLKQYKIIKGPLPQGIVADKVSMTQNFPNPLLLGSDPAYTTIQFQIEFLDSPHHVELIIFDPLGREIKRLVDGQLAAGLHTSHWDGRDNSGLPVSTGIYFCFLRVHDQKICKKIIVIGKQKNKS